MRPDSTIFVVVVDDDATLRSALELILDGTPGIVCSAAFGDAESMLASTALHYVDVVLLDIGLPGMSGLEAIRPILERWPRAEILMQTVYQDEDRVFDALCAGAMGYLLKNTPPAQLIEGIREVYAGGAPMSASVARKVVRFFRKPEYKHETLSVRENEVLQQLIAGKTNRQIADELFISANTVAFHVKQIYEKLHVHSRAEAVARAMTQGRW